MESPHPTDQFLSVFICCKMKITHPASKLMFLIIPLHQIPGGNENLQKRHVKTVQDGIAFQIKKKYVRLRHVSGLFDEIARPL
jgi:hypothetical protein